MKGTSARWRWNRDIWQRRSTDDDLGLASIPSEVANLEVILEI